MIKTRLCTEKDLPQLAIFWLKMIEETNPASTPNVDIWKAHMREYMKMDIYQCYMAYVDKKAVGFIDGMVYLDPITSECVASGQQIYVNPEHRKVVGLYLYSTLFREGKKRGAEVVEISCYPKLFAYWIRKGMYIEKYTLRKKV